MLAFLLLTAATTAQCEVPSAEVKRQIGLSYQQFDSDSGTYGWRRLNGLACTDSAIALLGSFEKANGARLSQADHSEIAFHQGQTLAFNGREPEALRHFQRALGIGGDKEWITYVRANVAFLEHDVEALRRAIQEYSTIAPNSMRMKVLDGFLKCSSETYVKAVHCAM